MTFSFRTLHVHKPVPITLAFFNAVRKDCQPIARFFAKAARSEHAYNCTEKLPTLLTAVRNNVPLALVRRTLALIIFRWPGSSIDFLIPVSAPVPWNETAIKRFLSKRENKGGNKNNFIKSISQHALFCVMWTVTSSCSFITFIEETKKPMCNFFLS